MSTAHILSHCPEFILRSGNMERSSAMAVCSPTLLLVEQKFCAEEVEAKAETGGVLQQGGGADRYRGSGRSLELQWEGKNIVLGKLQKPTILISQACSHVINECP